MRDFPIRVKILPSRQCPCYKPRRIAGGSSFGPLVILNYLRHYGSTAAALDW